VPQYCGTSKANIATRIQVATVPTAGLEVCGASPQTHIQNTLSFVMQRNR
jgi:hypothetical protein